MSKCCTEKITDPGDELILSCFKLGFCHISVLVPVLYTINANLLIKGCNNSDDSQKTENHSINRVPLTQEHGNCNCGEQIQF